MARSLNNFHNIRLILLDYRRRWLQWRYGAKIDPSSTISFSARLLGGTRGAIEIGPETHIALKSCIIARDGFGEVKPVRIGRRCFIGGGAVILPGVTIGDQTIVGAGSVVMEDVPSRCMVVGNPARILRTAIEVGKKGRLPYATENQRKSEI
jgi:acetyltransferase-like isoleucine patch superfamily enzyme